jgi:hypothetical protein
MKQKQAKTRVIIQIVALMTKPETVVKRIEALGTKSQTKSLKTVVVINQIGRFTGYVSKVPVKVAAGAGAASIPKQVIVRLNLVDEVKPVKLAAKLKVKAPRKPRAAKAIVPVPVSVPVQPVTVIASLTSPATPAAAKVG